MIKCFVLATYSLLCTELPIDVTCLDKMIAENLGRSMKFELAMNLAASECRVDASGCCAWRGGVNFYDQEQKVWICNDGSESPSCGADR